MLVLGERVGEFVGDGELGEFVGDMLGDEVCGEFVGTEVTGDLVWQRNCVTITIIL